MDFMAALFGSESTGKPRARRKVKVSVDCNVPPMEVNGLRGKNIADRVDQMFGDPTDLPPEEEEGNIEYKVTYNFDVSVIYFLVEPTFALSQRLLSGDDRPGPALLVETTCDEIYTALREIREQQKEYRLRVENGRYFAVALGSRIAFLAPMTTVGVLLVSICQTLALKKLFTSNYHKPFFQIDNHSEQSTVHSMHNNAHTVISTGIDMQNAQ